MAAGGAGMPPTSSRKRPHSAKESAYNSTQRAATADAREKWLGDGCVDQRRVRLLTAEAKTPEKERGKSVVCYLQRDLRVQDNWALLLARDVAAALRLPLHVVHLLVPALGFQPTPRHVRFFYSGAREVQRELSSLNIGFHMPIVSSSSANQKLKEARIQLEAIQATLQPAAVVCDFFPLRLATQVVQLLKGVCEERGVPLYQVDSHSVVPTWIASNRLEVAARTLRPRLHALLRDFSTAFPVLNKHTVLPLFYADASPSRRVASSSSSPVAASSHAPTSSLHELPSEERLLELLHAEGPSPVDKWTPGTHAGLQQLQRFCCPLRLVKYEKSRNDPLAKAQSNLSPYLHFGQLSQQRCLLEVLLVKRIREGTGISQASEFSINNSGSTSMDTHERDSSHDTPSPTKSNRSGKEQSTGSSRSSSRNLERKTTGRSQRNGNTTALKNAHEASMTGVNRKDVIAGVDAFVEEAIVRCALSENFVFYCGDSYEKLKGAPRWAQESLLQHEKDPRVPSYERHALEAAETYDPLWNAAQLQIMREGKMHGYLRMYWAKKMLEWMKSPAEALAGAIYLNDKYSLDGTDPNGYVGCLWSIAALHDQPFKERPIFGKVRYMNYAGCQRKFHVNAFIQLYRGASSSAANATQDKQGKGDGSNIGKIRAAKRGRSSSGRDVGEGEALGNEGKKKAKMGPGKLMRIKEEEQTRHENLASEDEGTAAREKRIQAQQKRAKLGKRGHLTKSERVEKRRPEKGQKKKLEPLLRWKLQGESDDKLKHDIKEEKTGKTLHRTKRTKMEQ